MAILNAKPAIIDLPEIVDDFTGTGPHWIVTVFNNETNSYDEVIEVLMRSTGCDFDEAYMETWEIDHLGKSVVHQAEREECEDVAAIISRIGIEVKVSCE